jgi:intein/homing endonuclease
MLRLRRALQEPEAPQDDRMDALTNDRDRLISGQAYRVLRKEFGPRYMPFFDLYGLLHAYAEGEGRVPPEGWAEAFRTYSRLVYTALATDYAKTEFSTFAAQLRPLLNRLDEGMDDRSLMARVADFYARLVQVTAQDRGVFLAPKPMGRWSFFRIMSEKEQKLEQLRQDDPELYDTVMKSREVMRTVDREIEKSVANAGLIPSRKSLLGKPVHVGTDPVTGEEVVFDDDGSVLPVGEYVEKRKADLRAQRVSERVFPRDLDQLRRFSEADLEGAVGDVQYVSLTDDKAKSSALTRIYPTKLVNGTPVVVEGRFKGFAVPDLVNAAGRLIEGTAYDFDAKTGRPVPLETKNPDGSVNVRVLSREPYVTLDRGQLLLRLPSTMEYTQQRRKIAELARLIPSLKYVEGSRKSLFTFAPKDFAAVREALGGMALSTAAMKRVKEHFTELARHERAAAEENLQDFTAESIGGFRTGVKLLTKQKQALAWMESRGRSGVIALDTGIGKCVRGDTLVSTDRGLLRIDELVPVGLAPDTSVPAQGVSVRVGGETLSVKHLYYGGHKPTVRVVTHHGFEVEGSQVHPLLVRRDEGEVFVQTRHLIAGADYVCVERNGHTFPTEEPKLSLPETGHFNEQPYTVPDRMNPDLARLLGYIVAEGWVNNPKVFAVSQCPNLNPETRADIDALLLSQFGWQDSRQAGHKDTVVASTYLRRYMEGLGVDYTKSAGKVVPPVILRATRESVLNFVRAFVDAEGSVDANGGIEVSSASEALLRELQLLLLHLGVVSRRASKKVKGYDHTYWRLTILGENARKYATTVGMVSRRKQEALERALPKKPNPNLDAVPHAKPLVEALRTEIFLRAGGSGKGGGLYKTYGPAFTHTLTHIRQGRRAPTYQFLGRMLTVARQVGAADTVAFRMVEAVCNRNYLYDEVVSVEAGFCKVYDIEVDDPRHYFVGNGIVNHNTLTTIAAIQKMQRDGLAEPGTGNNGRYLYVCPTALRGNLAKEAHKFLDAPKDFIQRVDVMSFKQFTEARGRDPQFGQDYVAVFFDEAQALKNPGSKQARAAMSLTHPRKVLLTASPMERSPMEVYALAAISNNTNLNTREGRAEARAFRARFAEEVGGRIMGMKDDPLTARDMRVWVKQNLYFADKRATEELNMKELVKQTDTVTMDPQVEAVYRETAKQVSGVLAGLVSKYRDRTVDKTTQNRELETARIKLAGLFAMLTELANRPDKVVPGARNTKLDRLVQLMDERAGSQSRVIVFTDSPALAEDAVSMLAQRCPYRMHAVGLADRIEVVGSTGERMTYTEKKYTRADGSVVPKKEWKVHVMQELVAKNPMVGSVVLTSSYAVGQNLQAFDTVVHLDRDTWNSETMKQRTARAWRQGQENPVTEVVLDAVYENPLDSTDATLDQIRRYVQELDSDLFDRVVIESQTEALGSEFFGMKRTNASFYKVNRRMMEMAMSPYLAQIKDM